MGGGFSTPGSASWTTTVTGLVANTSYDLAFDIASEGETPTQTLTTSFPSGSSTGPQSFTSAVNNVNYWRVWTQEDLIFTATATSAQIQFSVTNQQFDMGLDDVRVTAVAASVPEPASLAVLGAALAGLCIVRRRRKSA
jgi:hypothetical protein